MSMNTRIRGLIFATFFGNCFVVGLLLASLTTEYWVISTAKRSNATESKSTGEIHYGLFTGTKSLNVGYGVRSRSVRVYSFVNDEPDTIKLCLWLGTLAGLGLALLLSILSTISAVLKVVSKSHKERLMNLLISLSIFSLLLQMLAMSFWIAFYFLFLYYNILLQEDIKLHWYSRGLSYIGVSFYLLVFSIAVTLINITLLALANIEGKKAEKDLDSPCEEKTQGAIMLY